MDKFNEQIEKMKDQCRMDKMFFSKYEIEGKTEDQIIEIKRNWAIEDAADKIANAISSSSRRGFLWF